MSFETFMTHRWVAACGLSLALALGAACGDDDEEETQGFELVGEWTGTFGDETITETSWSGSALIEYDNDENYAITQTSLDAMFNPGKYNRLVYTDPTNDSFFYCTVDFGLDTVVAARTSTQTADASDPATGGCGTFPWTDLRRR